VTHFVFKGSYWRTNSSIECLPIRSIVRNSAESAEGSAPESTSDIENWLNLNGDLDNPNVWEYDWEADHKSDVEQDNGIEDPDSTEKWDVSAAPNVPGLIWPTRRSNNKAAQQLMTVSAVETKRNKGHKKK